jgi:hypothetical protein
MVGMVWPLPSIAGNVITVLEATVFNVLGQVVLATNVFVSVNSYCVKRTAPMVPALSVPVHDVCAAPQYAVILDEVPTPAPPVTVKVDPT